MNKIFDSGVDMKPYLVELASQGFIEFVAEVLSQDKLEIINQEEINQALFRATEYGHAQIVKMLIQNGADINTRFCESGELEIADWDSEYKVTEMTPLEIAKKRGHVKVINILIAAGARE